MFARTDPWCRGHGKIERFSFFLFFFSSPSASIPSTRVHMAKRLDHLEQIDRMGGAVGAGRYVGRLYFFFSAQWSPIIRDIFRRM